MAGIQHDLPPPARLAAGVGVEGVKGVEASPAQLPAVLGHALVEHAVQLVAGLSAPDCRLNPGAADVSCIGTGGAHRPRAGSENRLARHPAQLAHAVGVLVPAFPGPRAIRFAHLPLALLNCPVLLLAGDWATIGRPPVRHALAARKCRCEGKSRDSFRHAFPFRAPWLAIVRQTAVGIQPQRVHRSGGVAAQARGSPERGELDADRRSGWGFRAAGILEAPAPKAGDRVSSLRHRTTVSGARRGPLSASRQKPRRISILDSETSGGLYQVNGAIVSPGEALLAVWDGNAWTVNAR